MGYYGFLMYKQSVGENTFVLSEMNVMFCRLKDTRHVIYK